VANGVNTLRSNEKSTLIITHYKRLLELIKPDVVHVLRDGRIIATGGFEIVNKIENEGYDSINE